MEATNWVQQQITGASKARVAIPSTTSRYVTPPGVAALVDGTANQVIVTDTGDGSVTLSLPQDIDTTATPGFADVLSVGSNFIIMREVFS